jgi:hypothetical protein
MRSAGSLITIALLEALVKLHSSRRQIAKFAHDHTGFQISSWLVSASQMGTQNRSNQNGPISAPSHWLTNNLRLRWPGRSCAKT